MPPTRKRRPITDTQAIEKILGELHTQRQDAPDRWSPHTGHSVLMLTLMELAENLRGQETVQDVREIGIELGALAIRFIVECT